ncbi:MAG: PEP-CTERM sorting domain-containing protein [Planctomycetia bacterium]|nr:PEP-CTERM sorting domain-containing protein [Planctomycetia bacterium]
MMKAREFVTVAVVCGCWSILALLGAGTAMGALGDVLAGDDLFRTVEGLGSYYEVLSTEIPADFFGPGSEPFEGVIYLMGEPISPTPLGPTDTIVERASDASFSGAPLVATVAIEMVALSLVSTHPITVGFPGFDTVDYDVSISLTPSEQTTGQMILGRGNLNDDGGTISSDNLASFFDVEITLTFDKIGTGGVGQAVSMLDVSDTIVLAADVPWSHTAPDGVLTTGNTSNFFPGGTPDDPAVPPESLQFDGTNFHLQMVLSPEPATMALMVLGIGGVLLKRRRA